MAVSGLVHAYTCVHCVKARRSRVRHQSKVPDSGKGSELVCREGAIHPWLVHEAAFKKHTILIGLVQHAGGDNQAPFVSGQGHRKHHVGARHLIGVVPPEDRVACGYVPFPQTDSYLS